MLPHINSCIFCRYKSRAVSPRILPQILQLRELREQRRQSKPGVGALSRKPLSFRTRSSRGMNMGQKISGMAMNSCVYCRLYQTSKHIVLRRFSDAALASGGVKTVSRESPQPYKPVIPRELAQDFARPARLDILLDMPPASRECQIKHAWNSEDRSLNIFVKVNVSPIAEYYIIGIGFFKTLYVCRMTTN